MTMDDVTRANLRAIRSQDREAQRLAYTSLMTATSQPVDWAYEAWDDLLAGLTDPDNHVRSIAAQLLSNLARSDPERRMLTDFEALLAVTRDERYVTARHSLQSLWKVGAAGPEQRKMVLEGLARRFANCAGEKNATLIRSDIVEGLRSLYRLTGDESIQQTTLALIDSVADEKYRKQYRSVWNRK